MASNVSGVRARLQRTTVVDVGWSAVRAIEVDSRGGAARILKRGSAPLSPGVWDDPAGSRDRIAEATRAALAAGGIHGREAVAVVPRRMVTVKAARFPRAEPEQMAGMVRFEAQQYIPFPLDEVVLSHRVLGDAGEGMVSVLLVAARRSLVDAVVAGLEQAGVRPLRLAVSSLCLSSLVPVADEAVAVVVAEQGNVEIAIALDGHPLFSRAGEPADGVDRAAAVAGEIGRSLTAFQNEQRRTPVVRLILAAMRDAGVGAAELQPYLDTPVEPMGGPVGAGDPEGAAYAVALGAAIEGGGSGGALSLLPPTRAERAAVVRQRARALAVGALALVAIIAVATYTSAASERTRREYAGAARENRRLESLQKALAQVREEHGQAAKTYRTVMAGTSRRFQAVDVLKAVSDGIPADGAAYITQLTYERAGSVTLRGIARTEAAATELVLAYQSGGSFREARLGYLGDAQTEEAPLLPELEGLNGATPGQATSFLITCRLPGAGAEPGAGERAPTVTVRDPEEAVTSASRETVSAGTRPSAGSRGADR